VSGSSRPDDSRGPMLLHADDIDSAHGSFVPTAGRFMTKSRESEMTY